jgi:hypothetical protein
MAATFEIEIIDNSPAAPEMLRRPAGGGIGLPQPQPLPIPVSSSPSSSLPNPRTASPPVAPPRANPIGDSTTAFDRPSAVVVVGPRPLPVTIVGGMSLPSTSSAHAPNLPQPSGQGQNREMATLVATLINASNASGPGKYEQRGGQAGALVGGMVGGPIGAIVGQEVGSKLGQRLDDPLRELTGTFKLAQKGIRELGQGAELLARGDSFGVLKKASDGAAEGLEKVPIVGKAAAEGLRTVGVGLEVLKGTIDAFASRGRELSAIDARLASSTANADQLRFQSDRREAERLGPSLAKLIEQQAKTEAVLHEMLLPIKEFVITKATDALKFITELLIAALQRADALLEKIGVAPETLKELKIMLSKMKDIMEGRVEMIGIQKWLDDLGKFVPPPPDRPEPIGLPIPLE